MDSFTKQKKTIKRMIWLAGLLGAFFLHIIILEVFNGGTLSFLSAFDTIKFSQDIKPYNPVEGVEDIIYDPVEGKPSSGSSFRLISSLQDTEENNITEVQEKKVASPVVTFKGTALYPNSEVLLEINSERFLVSTKSDSEANWSWTNLGHPLEKGEHSMCMYNISPYEISGKRDVYADTFKFAVEDSSNESTELEFVSKGHSKSFTVDDVGNSFLKNEVSNLYVFNLVLLGGSGYFPGDEVEVQMLFSDLGKATSEKGTIRYELSPLEKGSAVFNPVMSFEDKAVFVGENSFLKRIRLKDALAPGEYVLSVSAEIGGRSYVQNSVFSVSNKKLIQIGESSVTREHLNKVLIWNILIILAFSITILLVLIYEYKRYFVYRAVDEDDLRKKGYFK